jgi:hypothetical protein
LSLDLTVLDAIILYVGNVFHPFFFQEFCMTTGATTSAEPTPFNAKTKSKRQNWNIDVRAIHSNAENSRGKGVLAALIPLGLKAFPGDKPVKQPKGSEYTDETSVVGELICDDPARQAAMLNILREYDPETPANPHSQWEMISSLEQQGQLMNIRVRPCYDAAGDPIADKFNVIFGARRSISRAMQYAMSCTILAAVYEGEGDAKAIKMEGKGDKAQEVWAYRPLEEGEENLYGGLDLTGGLPLLDAELVEGKDVKTELMAALAENRSRKDQSPIDEAIFFRRLKTEFGMTAQEIAEQYYGKAEATAKNKQQMVMHRLTLLRLPADQQERVHLGTLGVVAAERHVKELAKQQAAARATGKPGAEVAAPKGTPGQGERVKMPSVAQSRELFYATDKSDLSPEVKERFGKPAIWDLTRDENVRKFIAKCCGEKYITLDQVIANKAKEAAAVAAAEVKKAASKGSKTTTETTDETTAAE